MCFLSTQRITPRCGGVKAIERLYFVVAVSSHGGEHRNVDEFRWVTLRLQVGGPWEITSGTGDPPGRFM